MTEEQPPLAELPAQSGDGDSPRTIAENVKQRLVEDDVTSTIGAGRHEPTVSQAAYRGRYGDRSLDARLGPSTLRISKLRRGRYF